MLQDWAVGFGRNCALLPNTASGIFARVSGIEFSDTISGLFACAPVSHVLNSCSLRLEAGRKDF